MLDRFNWLTCYRCYCQSFAALRHLSQYTIVAHNVQGVVKFFNFIKGCGFLIRVDTNEDVFVHFSNIKVQGNKGRASLEEGQRVNFTLIKRPEREGLALEAINVTHVDVGAIDRRQNVFLPSPIRDKRLPRKVEDDVANFPIVEQGLTGTVKSYSLLKRYGFIVRSDNGKEVYIHAIGIRKKNPKHVFRSLGFGEQVQFDICRPPDGRLMACNVMGPGGVPVRGHYESEGPVMKEICRRIEERHQDERKTSFVSVAAATQHQRRAVTATAQHQRRAAIEIAPYQRPAAASVQHQRQADAMAIQDQRQAHTVMPHRGQTALAAAQHRRQGDAAIPFFSVADFGASPQPHIMMSSWQNEEQARQGNFKGQQNSTTAQPQTETVIISEANYD